MKHEFEIGDDAWTLDGHKVNIVAISKDGSFVVKNYMMAYSDYDDVTYDEEDGGVYEYLSDQMVSCRKLSAVEPVKVKSEQVVRLEEEIRELVKKADTHRQEMRQLEKKDEARKKRWSKYKQLIELEYFLEEKITHAVRISYASLEIMTLKEALKDEDKYYPRRKRLVSLFGKTDGDLEWGINRWSDGSGSYDDFIPAISEEDAIAKAKAWIAERLSEGVKYNSDGILKAAEKFDVEIPEKFREEKISQEMKSLEANLESYNKKAKEAQDKIKKLEQSRKAT